MHRGFRRNRGAASFWGEVSSCLKAVVADKGSEGIVSFNEEMKYLLRRGA